MCARGLSTNLSRSMAEKNPDQGRKFTGDITQRPDCSECMHPRHNGFEINSECDGYWVDLKPTKKIVAKVVHSGGMDYTCGFVHNGQTCIGKAVFLKDGEVLPKEFKPMSRISVDPDLCQWDCYGFIHLDIPAQDIPHLYINFLHHTATVTVTRKYLSDPIKSGKFKHAKVIRRTPLKQ